MFLFKSIVDFSQRLDKFGIKIAAPASGKVLPIEQAKFEFLGEGVKIQLEGNQIIAPVSGTIVELNQGQGKIVLQTKNKLKFLIEFDDALSEHHGLGIKSLVSLGQKVNARQPLLQFDLYQLNQNAIPQVLTFVLLTYEGFRGIHVLYTRVTAGQDAIFSLTPKKK
jgi:PTS system glucose-specific IIA component